MKKLARTASLLLIVLTVLGGAAACSNSNRDSQGTPASPPAGDTSPKPAASGDSAEWSLKKFDPPVTISTAIAIRDLDKLRNGDTYEDNPLTRWYKDNLGIVTKYKWLLTDQGDALNQKIRLPLASGSGGEEADGAGRAELYSRGVERCAIQAYARR